MYPGTYAETAPDRPAVIVAGSEKRPAVAKRERNSRRLAHRLRADSFRRAPNCTAVGDLGHADESGCLRLTDRTAFTISSSGVSTYSPEIENAVAMHPEAAAAGVPDPDGDEQVKTVVRLAEAKAESQEFDADSSRAAVPDSARSRLRTPDFVDSLPRTPTGKLVKGPLRDRYRAAAR